MRLTKRQKRIYLAKLAKKQKRRNLINSAEFRVSNGGVWFLTLISQKVYSKYKHKWVKHRPKEINRVLAVVRYPNKIYKYASMTLRTKITPAILSINQLAERRFFFEKKRLKSFYHKYEATDSIQNKSVTQ